MRAYIEGVRFVNDSEVIPCATRVQAERVIRQICAHNPEVTEDDLEITEIVFPSIWRVLSILVAAFLTKLGG